MSFSFLTTDLVPEECEFLLSRTERINSSKFTTASQVISSPTGLWTANLKFTNVRRAQAQELTAFLWSLRGAYGQFRLFDWSATEPNGAGGSYAITQLSLAAPGLVVLSSARPHTKLASAGDYAEINGELKGLTEDVITDSLGNATVMFEPFLRTPATAATQIKFNRPTGLFRLTPKYEVQRASSKKMVVAEISIECIEAVTL
ncbi:hypothetical protein [Vibrio quintilis]|uniref:Uncharacterized protein n=1 Tax=Vibrio quintilis TaxID=1117707 RepID=A0A1M7Z1V9_9VIBR|nr:hypothetical protein [Vibrio quintilis]SHO58802.1 hypothetical protein VQ7734_04574 [Vibrio quintilis]